MESRRSADTQLGRTSPKHLRPDNKPVISSFLNVYILKNQQKVFAYPRYLPDNQVSVWYYCTYHSAKLPPYPVLEAPIDVRYTPSDTFGLRLLYYIFYENYKSSYHPFCTELGTGVSIPMRGLLTNFRRDWW